MQPLSHWLKDQITNVHKYSSKMKYYELETAEQIIGALKQWNEYNWNVTSNRKFETILESQSQSFHACEKKLFINTVENYLSIHAFTQQNM
jgi:hypothetical protein